MKLRRVLATSMVALVVGVGATIGVLWHEGYRAYVVHTGSMVPNYNPGDLVIDRPASGHYQRGEVITFRHSALSSDVVTHRIVSVTAAGIRTKGDANPTADAWVIRPNQVRGAAAWRLPGFGYVAVFVQQPFGIAALATGVVMIALLWSLFFPSDPPVRGSPATARHRARRGRHAARPGVMARAVSG
jgi:signal peptidase I